MGQRRIVLAADDMSLEQLLPLTKLIGPRLYAVKVHDLYDEHGKELIRQLKNHDVKVWVDAKLHDIPATVAKRAAVFKRAGADILTVHASGGIAMMRAAKEHGPAEIYAVTVLTSLSEDDALSIYNNTVEEAVNRLFEITAFTHESMDGVVCSPIEVARLKERRREHAAASLDFWPKLVTPGIRSAGKDANDQKRISTPAQAIQNGSDLLVIGRQITTAKDPLQALEEIEREIAEAEVEQALSEQRGGQ